MKSQFTALPIMNLQPEKFTELARKNPVHFLNKSAFFNYDEINRVFYLSGELKSFLGAELAGHVKEILEYRRNNYFKGLFKEGNNFVAA